MNRRNFFKLAGASTLALATSSFAKTKWSPRRPINIIVPYKAGGGVDLYARALVSAAKKHIRVPLVVVNKPGAGGMSGAIVSSQARPDGNTILLHSAGSFLLRHMFKDTKVGPFNSFQTIAQIGNLKGAVIVPADSPYKTLDDLVKALKEKPGKLRWGHNGRGATYHVIGQTFLNTVGLKAVDVPFKGGAASRAALIGSQVDFGILGIQQVKGFESNIRVLAVADSQRDDFQVHVPTFKEAGYDIPIISSPLVLFAPNGVKSNVISGMEEAFKDVVSDPEFGKLLASKGNLPVYRKGNEAKAYLENMQKVATPVIEGLR